MNTLSHRDPSTVPPTGPLPFSDRPILISADGPAAHPFTRHWDDGQPEPLTKSELVQTIDRLYSVGFPMARKLVGDLPLNSGFWSIDRKGVKPSPEADMGEITNPAMLSHLCPLKPRETDGSKSGPSFVIGPPRMGQKGLVAATLYLPTGRSHSVECLHLVQLESCCHVLQFSAEQFREVVAYLKAGEILLLDSDGIHKVSEYDDPRLNAEPLLEPDAPTSGNKSQCTIEAHWPPADWHRPFLFDGQPMADYQMPAIFARFKLPIQDGNNLLAELRKKRRQKTAIATITNGRWEMEGEEVITQQQDGYYFGEIFIGPCNQTGRDLVKRKLKQENFTARKIAEIIRNLRHAPQRLSA